MGLFVIRDAQMEALEPVVEQGTIDHLTAHVVAHDPACVAGVDPAEARARVAHAVGRARRHGLTRDRALGEFVRRALAAWPDFETDPAVDAVLQRVAADESPDARFVLFDLEIAEVRAGSARPANR